MSLVPRFLPAVKQSGREVDHWPPSSAKIKNEQRYTSAPPVCFHGMERYNFTFINTGEPVI